MSSVIGTLVMVLITVTMALALSDFMTDAIPDPGPSGNWELGTKLDPGNQRWGDGDETVVLTHRGGPDLRNGSTKIGIDVDGQLTTYEGVSLASAFDDGAFVIGERWTKTTEISPNASVSVSVVVTSPRPRVVATAALRSGQHSCSSDVLAPYVDSWSQDPGDVDSATIGGVTVVATLADACSGVNATEDPHIEYRFTSNSTFTDAGAMTHVSGTSWRGEIPEPTDGWDAKENETLIYRLDPMIDLAGNNGTSEERTDDVEPGANTASTLTYATEHVIFSGTVENITNLENGTDGGHAANLTENATGSGTVTSEMYGTAHSSSGATSPGNATGSPDDAHAVLPSDNAWVSVTGYNTFQGEIRSVEIAIEAHYVGTVSGAEDEVRIFYEVSGSAGATDDRLALSELNEGSDGPATFVNVTADRSWTWADVSNMAVKAAYEKNQGEDDVDFHVDALWMRVVYDDQAYNLSVQVNVTDVPSGSDQDLEVRHDTTGEAFHVEVYNNTSDAWAQRGLPLDETTPTTWTLALEDDELDAGTVRLRFVDDGPDATDQDTLAVDFVRVRTR